MSKTAAITGAGSGLGFDLSMLLAQDGYNLILNDIDGTKLQQSKDLLVKESKIEVNILELDLSKPDAADEVYKKIKSGIIDILINNAGFGLWGSFAETDWKLEKSMLYLHVITPTHLTKLVIKDKMARMAYKAILKGKSVYIPTIKNRILAFISWLLPRRIVVRMIRATQTSIHK